MYIVSSNDSLDVSIPSVIENGNLMLIGSGDYSMKFASGILYSPITKSWEVKKIPLSPEAFVENRKNSIESGWVDTWPGGRCFRSQSETHYPFRYIHSVEYYC